MCKPTLEKCNVGPDAVFNPISPRLFAGCVCVNPRLKGATWDQMSLFLSNKPQTICWLCMSKPTLEKCNEGPDAQFNPISSRLFAGCVCVNPRLKRATWDQMSQFLSNKPQTICWLCMCKPTLEKCNVGPDAQFNPISPRLFAGCVCVNPHLKNVTWGQMPNLIQ